MARTIYGMFTGIVLLSVFTLTILGGHSVLEGYFNNGKGPLVPYYEMPDVWVASVLFGALIGLVMADLMKDELLNLAIYTGAVSLWAATHGVLALIAWPNQQALIAIGVSAWCTGIVGILIYRKEQSTSPPSWPDDELGDWE